MSSINIFEDTPSTNMDVLMDFRPNSTTLSGPELLPLNNNHDERFQQNILINGKTKYEEENTIIKSLEEEIVNMKHKMSFVYEKDEEISNLKEELRESKKLVSDLQSSNEDLGNIMSENRRLKEELDSYKLQVSELNKLKEENELLSSKLDSELDSEPKEEMIDVNIPHLRKVLMDRLRDKQTQHIDTLIDSYKLHSAGKVKKSVMERMLEEAIHLT